MTAIYINGDEIKELLSIQNSKKNTQQAFKDFIEKHTSTKRNDVSTLTLENINGITLDNSVNGIKLDDIKFGAKMPSIRHNDIRNTLETLNALVTQNKDLQIIINEDALVSYKGNIEDIITKDSKLQILPMPVFFERQAYSKDPEGFMYRLYNSFRGKSVTEEMLVEKFNERLGLSGETKDDIETTVKSNSSSIGIIDLLVNLEKYMEAAYDSLSKKGVQCTDLATLKKQLKEDTGFNVNTTSMCTFLSKTVQKNLVAQDLSKGNIEDYIIIAHNNLVYDNKEIIPENLSNELNKLLNTDLLKKDNSEIKDLTKILKSKFNGEFIDATNKSKLNTDVSWENSISAFFTYLLRQLTFIKEPSVREEKVALKNIKETIAKTVLGKNTEKVVEKQNNPSPTMSKK